MTTSFDVGHNICRLLICVFDPKKAVAYHIIQTKTSQCFQRFYVHLRRLTELSFAGALFRQVK